MTKPYRVGFIGAGNMAAAIAGGMVRKGLYAPNEIIMSNRSQEKLQSLHKGLGVEAAKDNKELAAKAELIILAVKPQQFPTVAAEIAPFLAKGQVVVSIMAGLTLAGVKDALGDVGGAGHAQYTGADRLRNDRHLCGRTSTARCAGDRQAYFRQRRGNTSDR